jgi:NAD(P)-dependent dehydrogenase (short-subunit alcohol dehydrogenase family)
MKIDLTGQCILVTGASRGIGAAIARGLADCGARVALHAHANRQAAAALAGEIGNGSRAFAADLADPAAVARLWPEVHATMGSVDGIVNNAGIAIQSPLSGSVEAWVADWNRTMAVNLTAAAILCRAAIEHFESHGGGRIVNISSRAAFRGDQPDFMAYAASKGGMVALTRSIARGYGKSGIKAFTIAPGFTRTDMAQDFIDQYGEDYATSDIALDRLTEPADIAPAVAFLLSGLSDHATGATLDMNAASYVH